MATILDMAPTSNLTQLYSWCNARYFDNDLPENISCTWNSRTSKARGRMIHSRNPPYKMRIDVSENLKGHPSSVLNTMVHEMIHVWQIHNHEKTRNEWFLDNVGIKRHLGMNKGHGPAFFSQMNRLNKGFPELSIDVKDDIIANERLSESDLYGIMMVWMSPRSGKVTSLFKLPQKPTQANLNSVKDSLAGKFSAFKVLSVDLISTQHHFLNDCEKITKSFELRKNYRISALKNEYITPFISHPTTQVIGGNVNQKGKASSQPIYSDELEKTSNELRPFRGMDLVSFAQMFCRSMPYLKTHGDLPKGSTLISGQCTRIPKEISERIKSEWMGASKNDIFVSAILSDCVIEVSKNIGRVNNLGLSRILEEARMRIGPKRISREEFADCFEIRASDMLDNKTAEACLDATHLFKGAKDMLLEDRAISQGYRYLDKSYSLVLGHTAASAFSAGIDFDQKLIDKVKKVWESPSKLAIQSTQSFVEAKEVWSDMLSEPDSQKHRDVFESILSRFGGRIDRKAFSQVVMVEHIDQSKGGNSDILANRNLMKSLEIEPINQGQLAFAL